MSENPKLINFDTAPPIQVVQYDDMIRKFVPGYDAIFQLALAHFQVVLASTPASLLIVGAGSGKELITFGQADPTWTLTGVDPSAHMLSIARQKIAQYNLAERVTLHQGFVEELLATTEFDAATCILVMHFLPDNGAKLALLSNIAARLKVGAPLVLVDIFGGRSFVKELEPTWIRHGEQMGLAVEAMQKLGRAQDEFYPIQEERTLELFKQAGFANPTRFYTALFYGGWIVTKARQEQEYSKVES